MHGIIYKVTNKINGKIYIGQTTYSIEKRMKEHKCVAKNKIRDSIFPKALKKYGFENFTFEEIDTATNQLELDQKEIYWIKKFKSFGEGYNLTEGGLGGRRSEITKRKISIAVRKRCKNSEYRKKLSLSLMGNKCALGHKQTPKEKENHRNAALNADRSYITKEWRKRHSDLHKGQTYRANVKYLITFPDNSTKEITNMTKFCKENSLCKDRMYAVIKGKQKHHHGLKVQRMGVI